MSDESNSESVTQFFDFSKYAKGVSNDVSNINYSNLPKYKGKSLDKVKDEIIQQFNNMSEEELFLSNPKSEELEKFFKEISYQIFDGEVLHYLLNSFPLNIPMSHKSKPESNDVKNLTLFYISIIQKSEEPLKVLHYIISHFAIQKWHRNKSANNDTIRSFCICKNKKDVPLISKNQKKQKKSEHIDPKSYVNYTWVITNPNKWLFLYKINDDMLDEIHQTKQPYSKIQLEKGAIKFIYNGDTIQKLYPASEEEGDKLVNPVDFPLSIFSIPKRIPNLVYSALYEAITSDDLLVLRSLLHYSVVKVSDGLEVCESLLKIFSYANKTNAFLAALVGSEFDDPTLIPEKILRVNSHFTNVLKVINRLYGKNYFEKVIQPIIKYIIKKGNIGLKGENADKGKAEVMLFTIIKYILASGEFVPPQIRHVISLIRSFSAIRFNDFHSVYNAISGFFFLRFFSSSISDPSAFVPKFAQSISEEVRSDVIMPFIPILQTVLNMKLMRGKSEKFSQWNERIQQHVFPKIVPFVFSLAEIDEKPEYDKPSEEDFQKALEVVLNTISENHVNFKKRYSELKSIKNEKFIPVGWCFGSFISAFYQNYNEVK